MDAQARLDSWRRWAGTIALAVGAMLAAATIAPRVPAIDPLIAFVIGFSAISISVIAVSAACPRPRKRALLGVLACAGAIVGLLLIGRVYPPPVWVTATVVSIALLAGASVLGAWVGHGVEQPGHLLAVAIVSSVADAWSVLSPSGPSAAIAESEAALSVLALPWPMLGTEAIEPMLGAGDVVFAALYVAAGRAHGLASRRTLLALGLGFLATLGCVLGFEQPLPALPLLGLAMIVAHPEARRLQLKRSAARLPHEGGPR